jgi:hypothetical protein
MSVRRITVYYFIFGEFSDVDFLKTISYKESFQFGKRRFVAELLCGVVVYPILEPLCFFFVKNNCSAIVYGTAPEDGDM